MSEPKTECIHCGRSILQRTAYSYEGLCHPCDNGLSLSQLRERLQRFGRQQRPEKQRMELRERIADLEEMERRSEELERQVTVLSSDIWNCAHAFQFECPMKWSQLQETSDPGVRHCDSCHRDVYFCESPQDFVENGNAGRCVAVPGRTLQWNGPKNDDPDDGMLLGDPKLEYLKELEQKEMAPQRRWWRDALALTPKFNSAECKLVKRYIEADQLER